MRPGVLMILQIARQDASQATLVEDDNVIQAFTADRTDDPVDVGILPGQSRGGDDLRDADRSNAMARYLLRDRDKSYGPERAAASQLPAAFMPLFLPRLSFCFGPHHKAPAMPLSAQK
jgi:hypothetical protein